MATRQTRLDRGRRRGRFVAGRLVGELQAARQTLNVSQRTLARELGCAQSEVWRFENLVKADALSLVRIAEIASLLGLELAASLHPIGDPIRDRGHQALLARFRTRLSPSIRVVAEAPMPLPGDRRSWDMLLRIVDQLVGLEAETRVRDVQSLTRHVRERERDGGVDELLLVLAESVVNRRLLPQLLDALGPRFSTSPRAVLRALGEGRPIPGSSVLLI
jgi:transcriptional regulator with XRE-family HTH domain